MAADWLCTGTWSAASSLVHHALVVEVPGDGQRARLCRAIPGSNLRSAGGTASASPGSRVTSPRRAS